MIEWVQELETSTASEDFKSNLTEGKRYVDKTDLLVPILSRRHESTFFLRPRRFGKTLTLSMIQYFVEDTRDEALNAENRELFKGLKIMKAGEYYLSQMTSYPVIHLTMQSVYDKTFASAWEYLQSEIQDVYNAKEYLLQSEHLSDPEKDFFLRILKGADRQGKHATQTDYKKSLKKLTEFLRKDSGKRTVVLIDEYDVPLQKAYENGYYDQMITIIGPLLQNLLKTNSKNLQFAVITGCLRIAKEGIYTGLNNPEVNTVLLNGNNNAFGFTEAEVKQLLSDSGFSDHFEEVRSWYDGYRFGSTVIYNPWSVIKHIEALARDPASVPMTYWANTSQVNIIRELAHNASRETKTQIEQAMHGEEITFPAQDNIVYDELFDKPETILNLMIYTGYLTATSCDGETITAKIPNLEVHKLFERQVRDWMNESLRSFSIQSLFHAMENGNTEQMENLLNDSFLSAMSYYDTVEAFYHGVLLTLLQFNTAYSCQSNRESGKGRFDIACKKVGRKDIAYVFEVKISAKPTSAKRDAVRGAAQAKKRKYTKDLEKEGYHRIMTYGIAFCEKTCSIVQGDTITQ